MRHIFASVLMLVLSMSSAKADDNWTFEVDNNQLTRPTGLVEAPKPRTFNQFKSAKDFQALAQEQNWTFDYDVDQIDQHGRGVKPIHPRMEALQAFAITGEKLKPKSLIDFGKDLGPVLDQGQCGSCVVFSVLRNWIANMGLRGLIFPPLSAQHLMNCGGQAGQCSGDYAERVAQRLVNLKTLFSAADYKYTQHSAACSESRISGERYGKIAGFKTIPGTPQSILSAIHQGLPVSVTVAADNVWSSYRSGTYNGCSSMRTNHEVTIFDVDCGTSLDSEGNCVFDANGNLPAGIGTYLIANSWSDRWGDKGYMRSAITGRNGQKCNNVAEEALVLDVGIPMPEDGPTEFVVENSQVKLSVTLTQGAPFAQADAKKLLENALRALGE